VNIFKTKVQKNSRKHPQNPRPYLQGPLRMTGIFLAVKGLSAPFWQSVVF
jgi:hypothetical protein